ncbi:SMP-30/gluconolactonase/LRE family protein [Limnobacter humi]|uniref:SMP-30/gluconolactonase/LRE family protein n=1 Tax=Limnobacter humi TaxID=1778671 RepID=A0ABT1WHP0_9BURK|nr:SMP-30/gluconolactonase/LRE family protein [Limnobacter humi]MCQ8897026.1 SMP-30/gluconolactonase/LRE family protein [Limnobacter humi]
MNTLTTLTQLGLIATLMAMGISSVREFRNHTPGRFRKVASGLGSILAGLGNVAGLMVPFFAFFMASLSLIAVIIHARVMRSTRSSVRPWTLGVAALLALAVALLQPLGLKVLLLPKADDLPTRAMQTRVLKTFEPGESLEGIAVGAQGQIVLTTNKGLRLDSSDYYQAAEGTLLQWSPTGETRTLLKTPQGTTAGVPVVRHDGTIFMTSHGKQSVVWRLALNQKPEVLAKFPEDAWPNGLDLGPDGQLYSPDSHLGIVWKIDPNTGRIEKAFEGDELRARPWIALAPGANGLHFQGQSMFVTVSDRTTLLEFTMNAQGQLGKPRVLAKGIPGDDFAIDAQGNVYVTTHPYNTLVKVTPTGERTIVGGEAQSLLGPTAAAFGQTLQDANTLYVVTDGGAFQGNPQAKGQLIAVNTQP